MLNYSTYAKKQMLEIPQNMNEVDRSGAGGGLGRLRGAGDPLLVFLDLEIHQDSTIANYVFGKNWEKPIVLDPRKFKTIQHKVNSLFKAVFDLI